MKKETHCIEEEKKERKVKGKRDKKNKMSIDRRTAEKKSQERKIKREREREKER